MRLLAKVAAVSLALAALAGPALADPMSGVYGNTVNVAYADGTTIKIYINADGSYTGDSPMGPTSGTWAISGGQTCFTQTSPAPPEGTGPSCSATVQKKVGDSWSSTGMGGAAVTISITAGR